MLVKYRIKLLKDWTDPSGQAFKAGDVVEIDTKELAGELLADGIGVKAEADTGSVDQKIQDAVSKGFEGLKKDIKAVEARITEVHDKSDDDPSHGYLPERSREHTKDEKEYGLGLFAKDVYDSAARDGRLPERLVKQRQRIDKMLQKAAGDGLTVEEDSEGGFLIPPEFSRMLMDGSLETAVVRPRASTMTIGSDRIELPQVKNYDHSSDTVYGGMQAYWRGENTQLTESKPELEEVALTLHALTILAYASHKMMRFSPMAVGSFLTPKMADTIAWKEDDGFITGTGAGMPLGLHNAPGKIDITIETGQTLADSAFVTENAVKMFARLRVERRASVAWLYNRPDLFRWLSLMSIDVGTGGSAAGLITRVPGTPDMDMLGYPLVDTEHMEAAGTAGDITLTDLSQYLIADDRRGPEVAQSMHLKFDYGQEAFRIIKYTDGQPRWKKAFTRQNSTNTTSSIIRLAARS
jgi:HK97 family phage major capsid protein